MDQETKKTVIEDPILKAIEEGYERTVKVDNLVQENKQLQAEIQNQRYKLQKKEMDRISNLQSHLEAEDIFGRKYNKDEMKKSIEDRKKAVVFLNKKISEHIIPAPGSLIAIASMTNNGKSTLVAHIAEALVNSDKKILILSNEETEEDVRARVSCLRTGISFGDYKSNKCTAGQEQRILDESESLADRLFVVSSKSEVDAYRVTTVKGVAKTLKQAINKVDCVIIDYYNNVNISEFGAVEPWHVNNELATELNIIKNTANYPIIVMAQCQGIKSDKKMENKGSLDFESNHPMYRWKGGQNLLVYATDIIELVRDFDNSCSFLFAHKVRFSHGDLERLHMLPFDRKMQRFVEWSAEFDASVTASKVTRESREKEKELGFGNIFKEK